LLVSPAKLAAAAFTSAVLKPLPAIFFSTGLTEGLGVSGLLIAQI